MIPNFQTAMLPVLKLSADGLISNKEMLARLADHFELTEAEREQKLPVSEQSTFYNRILWARTYLKQAGLISYPIRAHSQITEDGKQVLANAPARINVGYLSQFPSFVAFRSRRGSSYGNKPAQEIAQTVENHAISEDIDTPDEALRKAHANIHDALGADILARVREATPDFFEDLIIDLLLKMGYGGASDDAGRSIGKSGDDGVDGVIDQDPLGVDQIYVQAKRFAEGNTIGSGAIRDFFGALNLKGAQKGLFFTTSKFSAAALDTAEKLNMRIVLIDGIRLSKLMIQYNVGCREEETLILKKVDEDFFENNQ